MTKKKASDMLKLPNANRAMVRAMVELGRYEDDCGLMQGDAPPSADAKPPQAAQLPSNVVFLPAWSEAARGVPNGVLRSALFGAVKKGPRPYLEREEIHALDGVRIVYTGPRLDQGDLDVWEAVLHLVRQQALGDECRVTAYQLLKLLGKADTGSNRDVLDRRLRRLKANGLDIHVGRYGYEGSLIDEIYRDEETLEYVIRLNPKLRPLFDKDQWTALDWAVRVELGGQPLAQWLHGFYATHAKPYPMSVEKLHKLCGSETEEIWKFKQLLARALEAVSHACEKHGQAFKAEIRDGLVHVDRQPSSSQQRHLDKKAKPPTPEGRRRKAMTPVGELLKPPKK